MTSLSVLVSGSTVRCCGFARVWYVVALLVVAGVAAASFAWHDWSRFTTSPLAVPSSGVTLDVARGSGLQVIVAELRERHLTAGSQLYWRALAEQMHVTARLHAGEYALPSGITARDLLTMLARGEVLQHRFTLVDGWTFHDVRVALNDTKGLLHDTHGLDDAAVMARLDRVGENPEGRFLPETYAWVKGDSDLDLLRRAARAMDALLAKAWPARAANLPLKAPEDALILASLVEKETGRGDERARIAGVFVRRLELGMPLATDPSIIYGMGDSYQGNIRKRDLETDTPYNTYLRAGLPPTPIAMPGKAAIEAALHPAAGKDLYFVARGDGSGGHVFSATLAEHNRAVACYQLKRCG